MRTTRTTFPALFLLLALVCAFSALLLERKIPHEYRQLPGGHAWPYRDRQVREILKLASQRLAPPAAAAATR